MSKPTAILISTKANLKAPSCWPARRAKSKLASTPSPVVSAKQIFSAWPTRDRRRAALALNRMHSDDFAAVRVRVENAAPVSPMIRQLQMRRDQPPAMAAEVQEAGRPGDAIFHFCRKKALHSFSLLVRKETEEH